MQKTLALLYRYSFYYFSFWLKDLINNLSIYCCFNFFHKLGFGRGESYFSFPITSFLSNFNQYMVPSFFKRNTFKGQFVFGKSTLLFIGKSAFLNDCALTASVSKNRNTINRDSFLYIMVIYNFNFILFYIRFHFWVSL